MANALTIQVVKEARQRLAGQALTERQAKLYSQRLRRDMGQQGLATFHSGDVEAYLDEALLLLQCSFLESNADPTGPWRHGTKRAAEILEWLSQSTLKPPGAPLHLLSAAAYQLAGYPAMALGHLRHTPEDEPLSAILREFLRAHFPEALRAVLRYWRTHRLIENAGLNDTADLTAQTFKHVVMCIGAICVFLRTGDHVTAERVLTKLEGITGSLLYSRDPYSHLLAQLTTASCRRFIDSCLWLHINRLQESSNAATRQALVQFARLSFINRRLLIWPAQAAGIERLQTGHSFVLCTPTGSGKTTIATLAIILVT